MSKGLHMPTLSVYLTIRFYIFIYILVTKEIEKKRKRITRKRNKKMSKGLCMSTLSACTTLRFNIFLYVLVTKEI